MKLRWIVRNFLMAFARYIVLVTQTSRKEIVHFRGETVQGYHIAHLSHPEYLAISPNHKFSCTAEFDKSSQVTFVIFAGRLILRKRGASQNTS